MTQVSSHDPEKGDGFDGILTAIGFGKWQVVIIILPLLTMAFYPIHMLGSTFLNAPVPFRCYSNETEISACNMNRVNCLNQSTLNLDAKNSYYNSMCLSSLEPNFVEGSLLNTSSRFRRTSLSTCPIVEYNTSVFESTFTSEFNLVCEQAYARPFIVSLFNVGTIFGSFLGGFIGDRWGRIGAVRIGAILNLIIVGGMIFSNSYQLILLTRFLIGFGVSFSLVPSWSAALECTPSKGRALVGMLLGLPFSLFLSALGGVAYFVRDWKYLVLFGSSPMLFLLLAAFLTPESPRWLIQKGRSEEGRKVLHWVLKMNRAETHLHDVNSYIDRMKMEASTAALRDPESQLPILKKFRSTLKKILSPAMRGVILFFGIIWVLHQLLYVGVSLNANNFTDNPFLYVVLNGFMDASAIILMTPLTSYFGRRTILMTGFLVGGTLFFLDLAVTPDLEWLRWVLVMSGFFLVAGTLQVNFLYAPEVFPTEVRARGFAFVQVLGSIGSFIAPFITESLPLIVTWGPTVVFGSAGIIGGLLFPFLPETKNQPLPETIQELEENRKRRREQKAKKTLNGVENQVYLEDASTHL